MQAVHHRSGTALEKHIRKKELTPSMPLAILSVSISHTVVPPSKITEVNIITAIARLQS